MSMKLTAKHATSAVETKVCPCCQQDMTKTVAAHVANAINNGDAGDTDTTESLRNYDRGDTMALREAEGLFRTDPESTTMDHEELNYLRGQLLKESMGSQARDYAQDWGRLLGPGTPPAAIAGAMFKTNR